MTVEDLERFPDDGLRREIIGGTLYVAAAPERPHQRVSKRLFLQFHNAVEVTGWGEVYYAPVDVRFSPIDQVQPDLLVLRRDRHDIYQGGTIFGPPDVVVEILSPSTRLYDLNQKRRLYAGQRVPEFWIADHRTDDLQILVNRGGAFDRVNPDESGLLRSTVIPELVVDPAVLFAGLDH
jgi:Uma2 family endonuclease